MSDVSRPSDYEKSDADPRLIGALALGVAIFLLVTPFALKTIYPSAMSSGGVTEPLPVPPEPRLQVQPRVDLDRLRFFEHGRLETFGWVERERHIAHIPIERAIHILARRGWSTSPPAPSSR
jgi:hypothetical protein